MTCPKCKMELVKEGGVESDGGPQEKKPEGERTIWICDMHKEEVFEKDGQCFKEGCMGMKLSPRKIVPGARLVFVCPTHPVAKSSGPGVCTEPGCGKKLEYKIESPGALVAEDWVCPLHPERIAAAKGPCPDCKSEMRRYEHEKLLAVPFSAVIDAGHRKVVFVDKGKGGFDAVEVTLGLRAGEYFPVLKGLTAGDRVATAGSFLLDAEARLNPAAGVIYFGASGQEQKP